MKLRRFEVLGLLPNAEPYTVYILGVHKMGYLSLYRRRVDAAYLIEHYLPEQPYYELLTMEIIFSNKTKKLGNVIAVTNRCYIKPAPHKVKRIMKDNGIAELSEGYQDERRWVENRKAQKEVANA